MRIWLPLLTPLVVLSLACPASSQGIPKTTIPQKTCPPGTALNGGQCMPVHSEWQTSNLRVCRDLENACEKECDHMYSGDSKRRRSCNDICKSRYKACKSAVK